MSTENSKWITDDVLSAIEKALKRGNTVELKKVNSNIEIIEIRRELKMKSSM